MEQKLRDLENVVEREVFSHASNEITQENLTRVAFFARKAVESGKVYLLDSWYIWPMFYLRASGCSRKWQDFSKDEIGDLSKAITTDPVYFPLGAIGKKELAVSERKMKDLYCELDMLAEVYDCGIVPFKKKGDYKEVKTIGSLDGFSLWIDRGVLPKFQEIYGSLDNFPMETARKIYVGASNHTPSILRFPTFGYCSENDSGNELAPLNLFMKWVDPARVEFVDHEIDMAKRIRGIGVNTPTFYGFANYCNNYYLLAERLSGMDFRHLRYSKNLLDYTSSEGLKHCVEFLSGSEKRALSQDDVRRIVSGAYESLGGDIRKLLANGVYSGDFALRNTMLHYEGGKPKVYFVDFEKTRIKPRLSRSKKNTIMWPSEGLASFERDSFKRGFDSTK